MVETYERTEEKNGLTLKLYRGEGMAQLAFNLDRNIITDEFVGFAVEYKPPGAADYYTLTNRLAFNYEGRNKGKERFPTTRAPLQKFRWTHVPRDVRKGSYRYRLTAKYASNPDDPEGSLRSGPTVTGAISLEPETHAGILNIGFTRGFASSQAYHDRFRNNPKIIPDDADKGHGELTFNMKPFEKEYAWLGFEARTLMYQTLQTAIDNPRLSVDALIYELREPTIFSMLLALGDRLRVIIDDHGEYGEDDSPETIGAAQLAEAGAQVARTHFGRQQHNKLFIVKQRGKPTRVLTGSTNFSLRGLYIQANNALLFEDDTIADLYAQVFDAYWDAPSRFRKNALSQQWHLMRDEADSRFSFCFSPHSGPDLSLDPIAEAISSARSSVLYSVVFLNQLTGKVRDALDDVVNRTLFSYGIAQRTGKLAVQKPDGSIGLVPFAYLGEKAPYPFDQEWSGGGGNMVHHKFVVTDFNGKTPKVFTGSSNLAAGGEKANGDNLILIEDRRVAIAYAIEALRMFDHFHFRSKIKGRGKRLLALQAPPKNAEQRPWWTSYYVRGHVKERDRKLFAG